jgi:two-component system cell cycle response regulator
LAIIAESWFVSSTKKPRGDAPAKMRERLETIVEYGPEPECAPETMRTFAVDEVPKEDTITDRLLVEPEQPVLDKGALTLLTGSSAGKIYELTEGNTILGRGKDATFKLGDNGVSRQHARIIRWVGLAFVVEDLGSANGTYINGRRVVRAPIRSGDRLQLGSSCMLRFALTDQAESSLQTKLYEGAARDPVTDIYTTNHLYRQMRLEFAYARRHDFDVSLVLVCLGSWLEWVKEHDAKSASELFERFAGKVAECGRIEDLVARYQDDVLAVLLRSNTVGDARLYVDRILTRVGGLLASSDGDTKLGLRIAVGTMSELTVADKPDALTKLCERRLEHVRTHIDEPLCMHPVAELPVAELP